MFRAGGMLFKAENISTMILLFYSKCFVREKITALETTTKPHEEQSNTEMGTGWRGGPMVGLVDAPLGLFSRLRYLQIFIYFHNYQKAQ